MSEERLAQMEEKLNGMTEVIGILVNAVNKLTGEKRQPHQHDGADEETYCRHHDEGDKNIRVEIPDFHGSLNPEELLDWFHSVERVFEYKSYDDSKKFKVAVLKLKGYASLWYEGLKQKRSRSGKEPLKSWEKLKKKLREKFIPADYTQELFLKLTHLKQDEGSVESYLRDFEQLTLQCEIQEKPEQKIARFLEGLDPKISEKVRLQPLWSFDEVVRLAQRIEKQGKSRVTYQKTVVKTPPWKQNATPRTEPIVKNERRPDKEKDTTIIPFRNSVGEMRRKCYQCQGYGHFSKECPTKKSLATIEIQDIEAEDETWEDFRVDSEGTELPPVVILPLDEGTALVLCRVMHSQPTPLEEDQRQQIFQTRCTVMGKVCHVLIDSGSCTNAASTVMVDKLNLPTLDHPQPYKLRWLSKGSEVQVNKQVLLPFSIGKAYSDQVLCDIIPMDACHILLGRPWEFDRDIVHFGRSNTYSFRHEGRRVTLTPLVPSITNRTGPKIKKNPRESLLLRGAEFEKEAQKRGFIYALITKEVRAIQIHETEQDIAARISRHLPRRVAVGTPSSSWH
ncbi:hypothetical protein RND81_01G073500 [Saponaria officinalis]|uniref:CCHC-type domain-containing protein n=1 Tax=Saponaria officinalis TaxID=3572 RepID=A0AAW1NDN2_SAPOF